MSDISFTLYPGSFYFLTGASGAGKTSLLKLLYLAQRPSRGMIRMFGADVITLPRRELPAFRRRLGVVFQDFRLVPHLSAFDNVALPLRVSGMRESEIDAPVSEMLDWVGLTDRADARPATLSGGEQQRVAIARAVIARPDMLVADEPTGNVDPEMALKLLRLFEALNRLGTTIVVATHDIHLLKMVPDSLIMRLDNGSLSDPTGALRYPPRRQAMEERMSFPGLAGGAAVAIGPPGAACRADAVGHRDHDRADHDRRCRGACACQSIRRRPGGAVGRADGPDRGGRRGRAQPAGRARRLDPVQRREHRIGAEGPRCRTRRRWSSPGWAMRRPARAQWPMRCRSRR